MMIKGCYRGVHFVCESLVYCKMKMKEEGKKIYELKQGKNKMQTMIFIEYQACLGHPYKKSYTKQRFRSSVVKTNC